MDDDDPGDGDGAVGGWADRAGSVRVRLTLAASCVTAAAVALTGALLVRSVEDTQTHRIRSEIEGRVDEVAQRLAGGAALTEAVDGIALVSVLDENRKLLISNPLSTEGPDGTSNQILIGVGGQTDAGVPADDRPSGDTCGQDMPPAGDSAPPPDDVVVCTDVRPTGADAGGGTGGGGTGGDGTGGVTVEATDPASEDSDLAGGDIIIFNQTIEGSTAAGIAGTAPGVAVNGFTVAATAEPEVMSRQVDTSDFGTVTVTAIAPGDEVAHSTAAVRKALWVMLPGLVGVVALVAWWLAGRALRPVEAIRLEAESIGGSTIHRRVPEPRSGDEIGRLARTMNAMLGRLDRSAQRQRQFVSDASHELRSPVAAIRTDLEVALHEGDRADWPTVARAVLAEEERLERLLNDLLVLAADEETAGASVHGSPVDMARLARDEAERPHRVPVVLGDPPAGDPRGLVGDGETVVFGVAARLDRVLTNLVDNAARHARSTVQVTVSREGDFVRTVVDDDGPGIEPADRERIFERFARLDSSRARRQGGAGLGLAVVRSIATRHGGYVWADVSPLGGARFTLDLPAAHRDDTL